MVKGKREKGKREGKNETENRNNSGKTEEK